MFARPILESSTRTPWGGHHRDLRGRLGELGHARGELIFFHQTAEAVLCRVARRFRVNLLPGAPADPRRIGDVGDRDGFVLAVGEDGHSSTPMPSSCKELCVR